MYESILKSSLISMEAFRKALEQAMRELRVDIAQLSRLSGVPQSTLYKLISGERADPRLSTFQKIVNAIKELEGFEAEEPFIAAIAARQALDVLRISYFRTDTQSFKVREYPVSSIEDVIVAAVRAQSEGAKGIVCNPIISDIIEKIVNIPICTCPLGLCREPLLKAIENLTFKISQNIPR